MTINTLVIGGTTGIGEVIVQDLQLRSKREESSGGEPREVFAPTVHDLDVTRTRSLDWYFKSKGDIFFHEVVYCAGVNRLGFIGQLMPDKVHECYDVNVIGFIRLLDKLVDRQGSHYVTPKIPHNYNTYRPARPSCSVVAIVSDSASVRMRGSVAYASSKAAMVHAIGCAARELAPAYRINGVAPSTVEDTPMTDAIDEQIPALRGWSLAQAREYENSLVPMGRRVTKEEVAHLTCDILEGPDFLTGEVVKIAGGK